MFTADVRVQVPPRPPEMPLGAKIRDNSEEGMAVRFLFAVISYFLPETRDYACVFLDIKMADTKFEKALLCKINIAFCANFLYNAIGRQCYSDRQGLRVSPWLFVYFFAALFCGKELLSLAGDFGAKEPEDEIDCLFNGAKRGRARI